MKTIKHILVLALIATFTFSCKNNTSPEVKTVEFEDLGDPEETKGDAQVPGM